MKLTEIKEEYNRVIYLQEEVEVSLDLLKERTKHLRRYNRVTRTQEEIYNTERIKLLRQLQELEEVARNLDGLRNYTLCKAVEALSKGLDNE